MGNIHVMNAEYHSSQNQLIPELRLNVLHQLLMTAIMRSLLDNQEMSMASEKL